MFKKFTNACVNIVQKYLPDAFIFCIVLTVIVFVAAMPVSKMNPFEIANAWGESMWSLLGFGTCSGYGTCYRTAGKESYKCSCGNSEISYIGNYFYYSSFNDCLLA